MATANITQKKLCSKCDKGGGVFTCDGCHQSFCRKHSDEHRQELAIQMDGVGQEHDVLQRDINKEADAHPLLSRIAAWERESINKIQQVAKQARIDLNLLINQKKQELKITMSTLTNELQSSREAEDYTELDLKKWIDQLQELRQDLDRSMNTYLVDEEDQRSIIRLIKVKNVQQLRSFMEPIGTPNRNSDTHLNSNSSNGERFSKGNEQITVSENGLVATCSRVKLDGSAFVFGYYRYSTGIHRIRCRIEKKINNSFFIGIVTLSRANFSSNFSIVSSISGWWLSNYAIKNGEAQKNSSTVDILQDDEITMIVDCDQRQVSFEHHRTKQTLQLSIDIQNCPLPWKLFVRFDTVGNCLRIIP